MKLIFDFDHTLYSTKKLYLETKKDFKVLGVNEKLFNSSFQESKRKGRAYDPEEQFRIIVKNNSDISIQKMRENLNEITKRSSDFLYSDVPLFLEKFKNRFTFYIISYGGENGCFSKVKIDESGIKDYFKDVFIIKKNNKNECLARILKKEEKAIFIDDSPEILSKVKEDFSKIITIRINRGEGRYTDYSDNDKIDFSIRNLKELEVILTRP
jgi:FMN phosphatase YigB (HAD superfamily)